MIKPIVPLSMLLLMVASSMSHADETVLKAVMQINAQNLDVVTRGLRNALEISEEAQLHGAKTDLKLVVSGPSLDQFVSEKGVSIELRNYFKTLTKVPGVQFLACGRTLKKIHKGLKDLLPGFIIVPSGPYEVLTLEKSGYLYIKP